MATVCPPAVAMQRQLRFCQKIGEALTTLRIVVAHCAATPAHFLIIASLPVATGSLRKPDDVTIPANSRSTATMSLCLAELLEARKGIAGLSTALHPVFHGLRSRCDVEKVGWLR